MSIAAAGAGTRPRRLTRVALPALVRWLRGAPRGLWLCAALATLNAAVWAVTTPSFQVPDEPVHAGYVQYLAETGSIPRPFNTAPGQVDLSAEETVAFEGVPFSYQQDPTWLHAQNRLVQRKLSRPLSRVHEQGAGAAAVYPPLYYALEAIPYRVAESGNFFDRLLAMRLLSALFAGATAAFTFLFVRELLPGTPWAWTVGGLAVAFQPLAAFVAGGVNPDSLLWTASAAMTWLIARAFRRGLTPGLGAWVGASVAAALLTKGSGFGLLPPAALALLALIWRAPPGRRRAALQGAALTVAVAGVPFGLWLEASAALWARPASTTTAGLAQPQRGSFGEQLSYLWQFFLPRLPGMRPQFTSYPTYPLWQTYFQGFVGRFGFFQWGFPLWVSEAAVGVAALVIGLTGIALARARAALRARLLELVFYVALAGSIVALVGVAGYRFRLAVGLNFEQTRYLFPLLPLYGALVAVAARGAGRRYGVAAGAFFVALAMAHNFFAVLLSIARYYG